MSKKKSGFKRKRLLVDPAVQGALIGRVAVYWFVCLITIFFLLMCWNIITGPARLPWRQLDSMWFHYGPVFVASLFILPIVLVDILRVTNRFAGPMYRVRRVMREVTAGKPAEKVQFREEDFWKDFADELNALMAEVERLRANQREAPEEATKPADSDAVTGLAGREDARRVARPFPESEDDGAPEEGAAEEELTATHSS